MTRLTIPKTYKLYINGQFPRTESGRSLRIDDTKGELLANICHGSRKDIRNAVEAASKASGGWAKRTAYNRGQILYRMAEMLEGKREEFAVLIKSSTGDSIAQARKEVDAAIDRLVSFAGWADKFAQVLGCNNPVAGPYYNFTIPQPLPVVAVIAPDEPSLLGLISLIAPPLSAGSAIVAVASEKYPIPAAIFAEVCATSDVPPGVINLITGIRTELLETISNHRTIAGISAANLPPEESTILQGGAAENIKRIHIQTLTDDDWSDPEQCESPWSIEPFLDFKTIWHPASV